MYTYAYIVLLIAESLVRLDILLRTKQREYKLFFSTAVKTSDRYFQSNDARTVLEYLYIYYPQCSQIY